MIWGKAEENKTINVDDCYVEIVFAQKEKINVTDELSYNDITAMLVSISEYVLYLSLKYKFFVLISRK